MKPFKRSFLMVFLSGVTLTLGVQADDEARYQEGKAFAQEAQPALPSQSDISHVPGYGGANPAQTNYHKNSSLLAKDALNLMTQSPEEAEASGDTRAMAGSVVQESESQRVRFDLSGDPLITEADQVIDDPLKVLQATKTTVRREGVIAESTHTCEESREEEEIACVQRRVIRLKKPKTQQWTVQVAIYNHGQSSELGVDIITGRQLDGVQSEPGGGHATNRRVLNPLPPHLHDRIIDVSQDIRVVPTGGDEDQTQYVKFDGRQLWINPRGYKGHRWGWAWIRATVFINLTYTEPVTEDDLVETIEDDCPALEARADRGECTYGTMEDLEGPGSRVVSQGQDTMTVHRDWWKRRLTYICRYPSKNDCDPYRARGCEQTASRCKTWVDGRCLNYQQTFRCQKRRINPDSVTIAGEGVPFCLDGNCDDHSWAPNQDFADAMAKLSVFKEMGKDQKDAAVFKGMGQKCSKVLAGFKDCCKKKGWGRKVGLSQGCTEGEKDLSQKRAQNLCVYVGTYCAERDDVTKVCLRKKSSYCCFTTKLARLVQEQGRAQLGLGFGSAEHPDCRPLRVDELQQLDFSQLNFAELYAEIQAKAQTQTIAGTAKRLGEDWGARVSAPTFRIAAEKAKRLKKIHDAKKESPQQELGEPDDVVM